MRNRKHDIEKYLRGELSAAEMHALEKDALSDPFLAEALEGVEQAGADNFLYDLHKINRSVHDRMRRTKGKNRQTIRMWGWMSGVAATILLIAIAGFLVVNMLRNQQAMNLSSASQEDAATPDSVTVSDSHLAMKDEKKEEPVQPPSPTAGPTAAPTTAEKEVPSKPAPATEPEVSETIAEQVEPEEEPVESAQQEREVITEAIASEERRETNARAAVTADRQVSGEVQQPTAGVAKRAPSAVTQTAIATRTIKGKVTDENGLDLPGVNVNVQGTGPGTVTDGEGRYELTVPPEEATLVFNFIGFETKEVPLPEGTELNVTLEENIATLSEVVVMGFSDRQRADDSASRSAEPTVGKNDFKVYLANSVKYPQQALQNKIEGKVTIRFTVEPTGQLSDFEVVKGIGSGCEEELIRAIRNGPYWKPATVGDQPVRNKVRVRYKFQLPK